MCLDEDGLALSALLVRKGLQQPDPNESATEKPNPVA